MSSVRKNLVWQMPAVRIATAKFMRQRRVFGNQEAPRATWDSAYRMARIVNNQGAAQNG